MDKPRYRIIASEVNANTFLIIPVSGTKSKDVYSSKEELGCWHSKFLFKRMFKDRL